LSELAQVEERFRRVAQASLASPHTLEAADAATERMLEGRTTAWADLPDVEMLRERAREIRMRTISDLDRHLADFTAAFEARGGKVHFARTAEEANEYIVDVCRRVGARLVAKSKSMASEEIRVNEALEAAGIRPVECDLGEYILQLAQEHPIHIILPAIEKTAADVAELFSAVEGAPVSPELEELAAAARRQLRKVFLSADVGLTGANFAVS
jgi:L-lactate dehydrogenase complex protein LldF